MRRISSSWRMIEAVLKENAHSAYSALRRPASESSILRLERLVGTKLPRDLVTSLRIHDGMLDDECLVSYMSLLPVSGIQSWLRCEREVQAMGEFDGNPNVEVAKIKNDVRWRPGWIPIMADAGGDLVVLDLDPASKGRRGQLFPWFNNGQGRMRVVSNSLAEWLATLADELTERRFSLDQFGGIQLRKPLA